MCQGCTQKVLKRCPEGGWDPRPVYNHLEGGIELLWSLAPNGGTKNTGMEGGGSVEKGQAGNLSNRCGNLILEDNL